MLDLAGQCLAKVLGPELVLESREGLPPPGVALLSLVSLHRGLQLIVAQIPTEFRRGVRLAGFAVKSLDLEKENSKHFNLDLIVDRRRGSGDF